MALEKIIYMVCMANMITLAIVIGNSIDHQLRGKYYKHVTIVNDDRIDNK
jgi:hypothetical protein